MDYKKLGAAIGVALKKSELSVKVGEFCGVTPDTVNGWVYGGCKPLDKNQAGYFRLIKALKIDALEFANFETVAGRITSLRFKNELSISDLTKACGKQSQTQFCQYELGTQIVSAKIAAYLAPALNTTPEYILFGDKKVEPLRNGLVDLLKVDVEPIEVKPVENGIKEFIEISTRTIGGESVNSVSARDLYLDLGLAEAVWSRWAKTNIEENRFFKKDVDFITLYTELSEKSHGKFASDFAVTIEFAKHMAMMAKTERAHDYRNYFIECEKQAKLLPKFDHLSPEVIAALKQARTVQLAMGMTKVQSREYASDLIQDRFGFDMEHATTGSCNKQLHLRIVK